MPDDLSRGTGGRDDDQSESLLEELRRIAEQVDPVPPMLKASATASLAWRTVDAELAELAFDSVLEGAAATPVREEQGTRLLSFEAPDLTIAIEVHLAETASSRRLVGQLDPPQPAEVEVRHPAGGAVTVHADELGRFSTQVRAGPISLHCRTATAQGAAVAPVVTDWVSI